MTSPSKRSDGQESRGSRELPTLGYEVSGGSAASTREMPDFDIRRVSPSNRREGRRCHSAYGSHARGVRRFSAGLASSGGAGPLEADRAGWSEAEGFSAGIALALVYPLIGRGCAARAWRTRTGVALSRQMGREGPECMKRKPSIKSLETVSLEEADAYLEHAAGDELGAAYALARDRNRLDGSMLLPDDAEVHHAFFLLCRARGRHAPSFDEMRVELRRRAAA